MIVDVIMPKLGESITEGTIVEWKKQIGDAIVQDETILEISTDKVDSEVPSPSEGKLIEILYNPNDVVPVGEVIARIGTEGEDAVDGSVDNNTTSIQEPKTENQENSNKEQNEKEVKSVNAHQEINKSDKFYSPLVKSIAKKENISNEELDSIIGSGKNGRVSKKDILNYLEKGKMESKSQTIIEQPNITFEKSSGRIEEMGRVRKKIAEHMVHSQQTSPHVYSTIEADVTAMVDARQSSKDTFLEKYGVKLTYTPIIMDACIKAIKDFPLINTSLDGDKIIHHDNINLGVAVALPDNNLIVPVVKSSEEKNIIGLARSSADLAIRARNNSLEANEIFGSTFTVTNPGIFGSLFGMAIINQPNVAILSVGAITKKPVVKETEYGDVVVIRSMLYLTLGYDHRIIDGAYGTQFLARIVSELENFDINEIK